ncbi:unnamed protein product [Parascedosporium putredinis]|uniref:Pre-mRNA-processing factor 19 n=1 Tax=Parascedosporium putredinis TaxID=1442378 RepID=A0A9P1MD24_9PEZI|nr:unnamed protein product [Parascedosporium putredinis]CAI8002811.1 unnamed protein product [Parascedosporium putredinis]
MFCASTSFWGSSQEPVLSKKSGAIYEKRLIEQYVEKNGTEPETNEALTAEDLIPLKTSRVNEWDSVALGTRTLMEELARTREELSTALYQNDAAKRVIARLTRERDEARDALSKVTVSGGAAAANGDDMAIDSVQGLSEELAAKVDETHKQLSKSRKKRPVPGGWVTGEEVAEFATESSTSLPFSQVTALTVQEEGSYAAISSAQGDTAIFSVDEGKVERQLAVNEPVTDEIWTGTKLIVSTAKGSVKVYDSGKEIASLTEHAGAATALALHPSGDLVASVGADKLVVFYHLESFTPVGRCYTDSALTTGRLLLGAPLQALVFSENGFWFAATAKGQTTVTVFDLRKEGDAAKAKVLEVGGAVQSLAWDYTGQFLATAGPSGVTVQQYAKGSKAWSEPLRSSVASSGIRWGAEGKKLVAVNTDGAVTVLAAKE